MSPSAQVPNPAHALQSRTLGEGVVVAILDTGIDPLALLHTPSGKRRILDLVDCTGGGDVDISNKARAVDGVVTGLSGRKLYLKELENKEVRLGLLYGYRVFPGALVKRLKKERKIRWENKNRQALNAIRSEEGTEWDARRTVLRGGEKFYKDGGPVYDVVVWDEKVIVDTKEEGKLENEVILEDFEKEGKVGRFEEGMLNFGVKVWKDRISVVVDGGSHGTHVAGIVSSIAPEAELISLKIGDGRLNSMETHQGLMRAVNYMLERCKKGKKVHVVNMSFGEHTREANQGRFIRAVEKLVYEHDVLFLSSAGNDGPGLSSVSAPGGTSEAMIGVGAYVTADMLLQMYTQLASEFGHQDGMPYTWSARGPTTDGARGVDICAPGGAIAEVPNWTVRKKMLMNGTSMASPCAAGCFALLVGGGWSGVRVRRAVENTAERMGNDIFAAGIGSVNAERAWEYLEHSEGELEKWRVKISVEESGKKGGCGVLNATRGIYLRGNGDCTGVKKCIVGVEFLGREGVDEDKRELAQLEVDLQVECDADWVTVPKNVLVLGGVKNFPVLVQGGMLSPGVAHFTEIRGRIKGGGVMFRVPVTVCKPEEVRGNAIQPWREVALGAGSVVRRFYDVPVGATYAILKVVAGDLVEREGGGECSVSEVSSREVEKGGLGNRGDIRNFEVHVVQMGPQRHCADLECRQYFSLKQGGVKEIVVRVVQGCLEVCLAQMWISAGKSVIEKLEMVFGGVVPSPSVVVGMGGYWPRVEVCNVGGGEGVCGFCPRGGVSHLRRVVSGRGKILGLGEREEGEGWQLEMEYGFEVYEAGGVKLLFGGVNGVVYESEVGGGPFVMVTDKNGQLMFVSDIYPTECVLQRGEYVVKAFLRHDDVEVLEGMKEVKMIVEYDVGVEGSLEVYESQHAAIVGKEDRKLGKGMVNLDVGEKRAFYFAGPKKGWLPKWAVGGDIMVGKMTVDRILGGTGKRGDVPNYQVLMVVGGGREKKKDREDEGLEDAVRKVKVKRLRALMKDGKWDEFEGLYCSLDEDLELKVLKMEMLDIRACEEWRKGGEFEKGGQNVVQWCDVVVRESEGAGIAAFFGLNIDPDSSEEVKQQKVFENKRTGLVEALFRKARMLALLALKEKERKSDKKGEEKEKDKEEKKQADQQQENKQVDQQQEKKQGEQQEETSSQEKDNKKPQSELDKAMKELSRWVILDPKAGTLPSSSNTPLSDGSVTTEDLILLLARRELLRDRPGMALKVINDYFGGPPSKKLESVEMVHFKEDLIEKLEWTHILHYEQCNRLIRFPPCKTLY